MHYNPLVVVQPLIVTYNVTNDSQPTLLYCYFDGVRAVNDFDKVEIDNIDVSPSTLDTSEGKYQLSNGIHTVKYTLKDPTTIGAELFMFCYSLTSAIIPDNVTTIERNAFSQCSLTNVTIPNSVTSIGTGVFGDCYSLTSVTIGNSVTSIGDGAFGICTSLTNITSLATTAPTIQSDTFDTVKTNGTLYVPQGSTGYDTWMGTGDYYLGKYNWTKVEQ